MDILDFYKDKNVVILGGRGYIGSKLKFALRGAGVNNIIEPKCRLHDCDWAELLIDTADVVFHLAAETDPRKIDASPATHLQRELVPTIRMLETCIMTEPPRIVFAGTVTQYGMTEGNVPVVEGWPSKPQTFYDINKQMIEDTLKAYSTEYGLLTATLRLANVYGPSFSESGKNRGFVHQLVKKAAKDKVVEIDPRLWACLRDYVYIDDVVRAFLLVGAGQPSFLNGDSYIVGSGVSYTFHTLYETLNHILSRRIRFSETGMPLSSIDLRSFKCNPVLMLRSFGWQAKTSLIEGFEEMVRYYS